MGFLLQCSVGRFYGFNTLRSRVKNLRQDNRKRREENDRRDVRESRRIKGDKKEKEKQE
jgi:hypothetical protein